MITKRKKKPKTNDINSSIFRKLNEEMYTSHSSVLFEKFRNNPEYFSIYHNGFEEQLSKWPISPINNIIEWLKKMNKSYKICDLGCGQAKISQAFPNRDILSLDLCASNNHVTICNISEIPETLVKPKSYDIAIFCLSLMGKDWPTFISEAQKILKVGGWLKIAEIKSRLENIETFIDKMTEIGFKLVKREITDYFVIFDFKLLKYTNIKLNEELLKSCFYKKR